MQIILAIIPTILIIIVILLLLWRFYFLRNPDIQIPEGKNLVLSPANGNIARIYEFKNENKKSKTIIAEKGLFGKIPMMTKDVAKEGYIILIRLHVYNVHWQRAPVAGKIEKISYTKGKFLNAVQDVYNMQCFFENEQNEILIAGKIKCKVIQIAGYLARRIECFVKEADELKQGDILGLINLGSQTALIVPKIQLQVKEGDIVKVGETIIGEIKSHDNKKSQPEQSSGVFFKPRNKVSITAAELWGIHFEQ